MSFPRNLTTVISNQEITVNATTTVILAANEKRDTALVLNTGTATVYLAFGENATTTKQPLAAGRSITLTSAQAINGIVSTGTGTVHVLEEGRS